ncbi:hypothetical protein ScPMuIL_010636 [Solemya velum]
MALHVRCQRCRYQFLRLHHMRLLQYATQVNKKVLVSNENFDISRNDELFVVEKSHHIVKACNTSEKPKWLLGDCIQASTSQREQSDSVDSEHHILPEFSVENVERLLDIEDGHEEGMKGRSLADIVTPFSKTCDDIIVWNCLESIAGHDMHDTLSTPLSPDSIGYIPTRSGIYLTYKDKGMFTKGSVVHANLCSGLTEEPTSSPPEGPSRDHLQQVHDFLIETLPRFFKDRLNIQVLHPNVILENNYWGKMKVTQGVNAYAMEMAKIRMMSHFKFAHVHMELLKSTIHPEDGTVKIRWRISGLPQIKTLQFWKFTPWTYRKSLESESQSYDGFSIYYVGKDGLVYKHTLDRMMPDEPLADKKDAGVATKLGLVLGLSPKPSLTDFQSLLSQSCPNPTSS